jgi:hypothetical protein
MGKGGFGERGGRGGGGARGGFRGGKLFKRRKNHNLNSILY